MLKKFPNWTHLIPEPFDDFSLLADDAADFLKRKKMHPLKILLPFLGCLEFAKERDRVASAEARTHHHELFVDSRSVKPGPNREKKPVFCRQTFSQQPVGLSYAYYFLNLRF